MSDILLALALTPHLWVAVFFIILMGVANF
jgi:hypothetical protein